MNFYVRKFIDFMTTLLLVTLVTFLTFQLLPGNPALAILGPDADQAQIEALELQLGLNQSLPLRYANWLKGAFCGNLGISYKYNQSVSSLIAGALKTTASLSLLSLVFTIAIGTFLGITFALNRKKKGLALSFGFKSNLGFNAVILHSPHFDFNFYGRIKTVAFGRF